VRGKVESIQAISQHAQNAEEHANRATRYFRLALRYAIAGSDPVLLAVMGRIASGKTTLARTLAGELDWPAFSSDEIRKTFAGVPLRERTVPEQRAEVYSESMTQRTYHQLVQSAVRAALHCGGAVIDATFGRRAHRTFLADECARAGIKLEAIEVAASDEQIADRLRQREGGKEEISDARMEDFAKLSATYDSPAELSDMMRIVTSGGINESARTAMLQLATRRAQRV
jgi:predicted kinase